MIRAYFTPVLDPKAVKFVEPIRDGFTIPSKGQFQRIIYPFFFLIFVGLSRLP